MMFLEGYWKSYGECFFVGDITRRWGFGLRHNRLSGFSRMGDGVSLAAAVRSCSWLCKCAMARCRLEDTASWWRSKERPRQPAGT